MKMERRGFLAAALVAAAEMGLVRGTSAEQTCREFNHPCEGNQTCCDGLICVQTSNAERCLECETETDCADAELCRDGRCVKDTGCDGSCACPDDKELALCVAVAAQKATLECELTYSKRKPRNCRKLFPAGSRNRQVCVNRNNEIRALHQECRGDVKQIALAACGVIG